MSALAHSPSPIVPTVALRGINKAFHGIPVLRDVDFDLYTGEVHALAGENGAGKSTLMKILQGVYQTDSGEIRVDGERRRFSSTSDALAAGIGMVFQEFSLIPTMSVARNIFLAREPARAGWLNDREMVRRARAIFDDMGVDVDPRATVGNLSTAYWQLTEIAKALGHDARVLIMDEPTASLARHETDALFDLLRRLKARGIAIIYISHRMEEIYRICDRITVLRDGRRVITAPAAEISPQQLVEHIVGRRLEGTLAWQDRQVDRSGQPILDVENLQAGQRVRGVSFRVHSGEVVGLAGLMGSGRSELARCLFGIDPPTAGTVRVRGRKVSLRGSKDAIDAGIALIPEDRRAQGLVLDHTVRDNLLLPLLSRMRRGPFLNDRAGSAQAAALMKSLQIKAQRAEQPVRQLSGGNQQKVVIAKWLATEPDILIMDEPAAGVDIGTKTEIVGTIRDFANQGHGVVLIESELAELLAVADRVLILRHGRVERELLRHEIPNEEFLQLAVQGV